MNKCQLCQQIYNNLTIIYNNRLKSLTQIILKLKGFKDPWDTNQDLAVCDNCIKGVENVALFWENIPEAKIASKPTDEKVNEYNGNAALISMEQNLPALMLEAKSESGDETFTNVGKKLEPIKLHIKLPPKRKTRGPVNTSNVIEPLEKRARRCPQRFDDFLLNNSAVTETNSTVMHELDNCNEIDFKDLPQVALLRLENNQTIGTLAEVECKGLACKIRISCQICSHIFRIERFFQKHMKTHFAADFSQNENYFYHCKLCDKPFSNHRAVRKHFKLAHAKERSFKCSHCDASFKYKFNLNYHVSTKHIPRKRYECSFCKKLFLMRYELQIHERTHTKERPYKCELCPFAFAHKSNLKAHQRVTHFEHSKDIENSKKSKTLSTQFIPPENLVEHVDQSNNLEECESLFNKKLTPLENFSKQEIGFETDSITCQPSTLSSEQIKHPEMLLVQQKTPNSVLNNRNISDSEILTNFEHFVENLEEPFENSAPKTIFESDFNIESESSKQPHLETTKILKVTATNESPKGFFKSSSLKGVLQLDSCLLKVLPATSLLGLKKWPRNFQSTTPNNQLQLVKSSTFFNNRIAHNFEANKTLEELKETIEMKPENSFYCSTSKISSSQFADKNAFSTLPAGVLDLNMPKLNLKTQNNNVLKATSNEIINIDESTEALNTRIMSNFTTCETQTNKSHLRMPLENKIAPSWKEIKVSSKPVKVKYITTTKQSNKTGDKSNSSITTQVANENLIAKEISLNMQPNILVTNTNLKPFKQVSSESLLKPQATRLSFTSGSLNRTLLHDKPLITNIEILPPLQTLTTFPESTTTASLIKPPVEYRFQCSYCYKYFKQKSPLTKHLRTHTGEKPYKCNLCPKSYADASNYKKHKILHKNAAEALNKSRKPTSYAIPTSPAYSTVSDPDPDGLEIMQTLKKFDCSSTEEGDDDDVDENDWDFDNIETQMWQDALDQALNSEQIRQNIRINLIGLNNAILPKTTTT